MNMGWKFRRRVWVGAYVGACVRARERVRAGGRARERVRAGHLHARVRVCGECVHEMGMEVQTARVGARARERVRRNTGCGRAPLARGSIDWLSGCVLDCAIEAVETAAASWAACSASSFRRLCSRHRSVLLIATQPTLWSDSIALYHLSRVAMNGPFD